MNPPGGGGGTYLISDTAGGVKEKELLERGVIQKPNDKDAHATFRCFHSIFFEFSVHSYCSDT